MPRQADFGGLGTIKDFTAKAEVAFELLTLNFTGYALHLHA